MFQCRATRCDIKKSQPPAIHRSYTCHYMNEERNEACGHVVLDLKRHLVTVHKLDRCCSLFEDLCEQGFNQKSLKRRLDTTRTATTSSYASKGDNIPDEASCRQKYGKQSYSHHIGHATANVRIHSGSRINTSIPLPTSSTADRSDADIYQFESGSESESESGAGVPNQVESEDIYIPFQPVISSKDRTHTQIRNWRYDGSACNSLEFIDTDKIVIEFQSFLLTKGGGDRRNTPVKGDISSFRCLVQSIGWTNFWEPNVLNSYVSSATCTPSTSYGRLRAYERFVHLLRAQMPNLLPSPERMKAIESMLTVLKEALGKDRHLRSKITMTTSRERMPHSLDVLREWRLRRESVEVKKLFPFSASTSTGDGTAFTLDEDLFVKLRNYLIVEVLFANAQRSGIIEGMLISEVLKAKNNANKDGIHYIYVEKHKTGYIQPAIIYLDTEIYTYLAIFSSSLGCHQSDTRELDQIAVPCKRGRRILPTQAMSAVVCEPASRCTGSATRIAVRLTIVKLPRL